MPSTGKTIVSGSAKQVAIPAACDRLEKQLAVLSDALSKHRTKLEPCLRPEQAGCQKEASAPPSGIPLAAAIECCVQQVLTLEAVVEDLTDRLEL